MNTPQFSVVIPARDEEKHIKSCIRALQRSADSIAAQIEIIVVLNRCSDATEEIARSEGCRIAWNDSKNLSMIRNEGAAIAKGTYLITVDADSRVSENMFEVIQTKMQSGTYVGGGVFIVPERLSTGIVLTWACLIPIALYHRIFCGLFFCRKEDFDAIGGFDEDYVSVEDIDFAKRLRRHGKKSGRKFAAIFRAYIVTSCRKFDTFGDWYFIRNAAKSISLLRGKNQKEANKVWYDFEH